jgi:bifunctional non-homologous end joining protein LigD
MPKYEFCIPTVGKVVPAGADWFHEVKYDGYRLRIEREGDRVRLITRGGNDWTKRFLIAEAALRNRRKQFVIDGEAVVLGVNGIADFNTLHSGKQNGEVQFCAFDVLAVDGEDVRDLPLSMRKANLERLLRGRPDGVFINPFEIGSIGPDLFRAACNMGLEGLVSKRSDRPYRGGRSPHWIKVKNRAHHAYSRVRDAKAGLAGERILPPRRDAFSGKRFAQIVRTAPRPSAHGVCRRQKC